ncbi:uncharacterized protein LOC128290563 [Gossypium arboreum]|uniref:uncharacterized protein LOC128290563 n=1 Tax=Gossypium arboreum TaxID=29729 RepID=UPI0022F1B118|nr:uncharacterized protein LOC128290563 [Gossypium arboreum]
MVIDALSRRAVTDLRMMVARLSLFDDSSLLAKLQVKTRWIEQFKGKQMEDESLDCLERIEKDTDQTSKPSNLASRGRPPRHPGNVSGSRGITRDSTVKSEARAPARTNAIHAREDASALDVITEVEYVYLRTWNWYKRFYMKLIMQVKFEHQVSLGLLQPDLIPEWE